MAEAGALGGGFSRTRRLRRAEVFGPRGLEVGHVGGIAIRIDPSWILIFLLVAWSAAVHFPAMLPGVTVPFAILMGVVASFVLFASVLVHELSHSLTALGLGYGVHGIKLFVFGGVSEIAGEPRSARDEAAIAIVGPLSSALIAGGLKLARLGLALAPPANALLDYLAAANIALAVFNMFPGLPLDGGRVLRAVFRATGSDLIRATRRAAGVGRALGLAFILLGFASFLLLGNLGGLWIALIGWFLRSSAESSYRSLAFREQLEALRTGDVSLRVSPLETSDTVRDALLHRGLLASDLGSFPVVQGAHLLGLVSTQDLRAVPRDRWDLVPVGALDIRPARTVLPDTPLLEAVELMARESSSELPVADEGGRFVGILRLEDVGRLAAFETPRRKSALARAWGV